MKSGLYGYLDCPSLRQVLQNRMKKRLHYLRKVAKNANRQLFLIKFSALNLVKESQGQSRKWLLWNERVLPELIVHWERREKAWKWGRGTLKWHPQAAQMLLANPTRKKTTENPPHFRDFRWRLESKEIEPEQDKCQFQACSNWHKLIFIN